MTTDEKFMTRCIELAKLGADSVSPNPMVGSVIVCDGKIIGEGFHRKKGEPHAEVYAINSVKDPELFAKSTLYVNLEPCSHYGSTPPCSNLIVEKKIPKVVIGSIDPFSEVAGKGIEKLRKAGLHVTVGILENECRELNCRFFTFHEKKRPYIILKWAQTMDGFIDIDRHSSYFGQPTWITGDFALQLVHKIRAEEDAIIVGRKTALKDNPSLTVRHWEGKNPLRLVTDKNLSLPLVLKLFDNTAKTWVFNNLQNKSNEYLEYKKIDFEKNIIPQIAEILYQENILSLIVEGGRQLLHSFIETGIWDESHVFVGNSLFYSGVKAPAITGELSSLEIIDKDRMFVFKNNIDIFTRKI